MVINLDRVIVCAYIVFIWVRVCVLCGVTNLISAKSLLLEERRSAIGSALIQC